MHRASRAVVALGIVFGIACQDASRPIGPVLTTPGSIIQDGSHHQGNPHFFFLPPMVASPSVSGIFDGSQSPDIQICELTQSSCRLPLIAEFTKTTGTGSEIVRVDSINQTYTVNWHTDQFLLDTAKTYRISVLANGFLLGFADVDVVASGKELKNVNTNEFIPLLDDRTLPIKFRIEQGALLPSGIWTGSQDEDDPSFGQPATWALRVNFDSMTARSSACLNPGSVTSVTATQIQVDYVGCGLELVTYARSGSALSASGNVTAYSGGRIVPSIWHLTTPPPQLGGLWTGTVTLDDPTTGNNGTYDLQINFGTGTATTGMCGNEGTVTVITPNLIGISYPNCGIETASYSISASTITASGLMVALSDGRKITTAWQLTAP